MEKFIRRESSIVFFVLGGNRVFADSIYEASKREKHRIYTRKHARTHAFVRGGQYPMRN